MRIFEKVMAVKRPVVFRRRELLYGWVDDVHDIKEPIYINILRHERTPCEKTYLHELLHIVYPEASEALILKLEDKVWDNLNAHQRFLLARKLYNRAWRTE